MKNFTRILNRVSIALSLGIIALSTNAQTNHTLNFDGTDDYVEIPYNSTFTPNILSVQLSVKINNATPAYQCVFVNGGDTGGGNNVGYGLFSINGFWTIVYGTGGGSFNTLAGPAVTPGVWTNIAGTYNGTTLNFYVNGTLVNSKSGAAILPNSSLPIRLGAGPSNGAPTYFFGGEIDELSMWSSILSPAQITANLNVGLMVPKPGLIGYYNFNEGIANGNNTSPAINTLIDLTTNHLDGTLSNFTLNGNASNWVNSGLILLPINLVNFEGSKKEASNYLQWSTASEQNSSYFEIQRSTDGVNFTDIAKVAAAGNSDKTKDYSYSDNQLSSISSVYYYRLKMVDIDGSSKYSSIISIKNSVVTISLAKVFPNPANNQFTITIKDNNLLNTKVTLNDISGKVLQTITITQVNTKVNISNYLSGLYILKFKDGNSIKVIKE